MKKKLVNLRELRERAALSQGELAERAGMSKNAVGQLERGEFNPRPVTVRRLAEALDVRPEELWGGESSKAGALPSLEALETAEEDEAVEEERRRARAFLQRFPHEEERAEYLEGEVLRIHAHYRKLFREVLTILKETDTDVNGLSTVFGFFITNGLQHALEESGVIAYINSVLQGKVEASSREREFCKDLGKRISDELSEASRIAEDAREFARQQHGAAGEAERLALEIEAYLAEVTDSGGRRPDAPIESQ